MIGSFEVQNKKYCVIPLTANKGDEATYSMSIQFAAEQKDIVLGKKYKADSMETHAATAEAIEKFNSLPASQRKVLTPYTLDKLINSREKAKPQKNKDSYIDNVRQFLAADAGFEDEAVGAAGTPLTSQDTAAMDTELMEKIMLGVDLDEEAWEEEARQKMSTERQQQLEDLKDQALAEQEGVLDFSYYQLGNAAVEKMIPYLELEHFLSLKTLDLSYNNLDDRGVNSVVQSLAQMGSPIEELNLSGNDLSDSIIDIIQDYIKTKLKMLSSVIIDECPKIMPDAIKRLKLAQLTALKNKSALQANQQPKVAAKEKAAEEQPDDDDGEAQGDDDAGADPGAGAGEAQPDQDGEGDNEEPEEADEEEEDQDEEPEDDDN